MHVYGKLLSVSINLLFAGGLDKAAVREVVRANIDDVRDCYNVELLEDETVGGRVSLSFVTNPDGTTSKIAVTESTLPERFDACLANVAASWSFPTSDASTSVVYPFELSPG